MLTKPVAPEPSVNSVAYEDIDACVKEQMRRLKIPVLALAIVDEDEIVHLRGDS